MSDYWDGIATAVVIAALFLLLNFLPGMIL